MRFLKFPIALRKSPLRFWSQAWRLVHWSWSSVELHLVFRFGLGLGERGGRRLAEGFSLLALLSTIEKMDLKKWIFWVGMLIWCKVP